MILDIHPVKLLSILLSDVQINLEAASVLGMNSHVFLLILDWSLLESDFGWLDEVADNESLANLSERVDCSTESLHPNGTLPREEMVEDETDIDFTSVLPVD
jgi:hypothetical protein